RFDAAGADAFFFKVAIHLEHVAVLVCAGETEPPVRVRIHRIVLNAADAEAFGKLLADLSHREVLARNPDRLADVLIASFENRIRALADVFRSHPRQLGVSHGEGPAINAIVSLLGSKSE